MAPGGNEYEHLSEVDLLVREDGGRQVHSRKRFGHSRKCCLLVQDDFLNALFPGEITDIPSFVNRYTRLKNALTPHICVLLSKRISVVLDFAAATKTQRAWFRELIERTHVEHELHFVDAPDAVCKTQLRYRSRGLPAGTRWTTEEDFEAINAYFQAPSEDEKFNVVRH